MAIVSIVPQENKGINQLLIDVVFRIDHDYVNTISEYEVEDGSVISDHVKRSPEEIVIEALTTNTPATIVTDDEDGRTQVREDDSNRSQLAFDTLVQWAGYEVDKQNDMFVTQVQEPAILTITTNLKVYPNMVIKNVRIPEDINTDEALRYVIVFRKFKRAQTEIFVSPNVENVLGKAPNIENTAQKKINVGNQKPPDVDDSSTLFDLIIGKSDSQSTLNLQTGSGATP
ncbi:MAG: hypothetical protein V3V00_15980 [Saprospiraceae bacterium]